MAGKPEPRGLRKDAGENPGSAQEQAREFSDGERVHTYEEGQGHDIFEEIIEGKPEAGAEGTQPEADPGKSPAKEQAEGAAETGAEIGEGDDDETAEPDEPVENDETREDGEAVDEGRDSVEAGAKEDAEEDTEEDTKEDAEETGQDDEAPDKEHAAGAGDEPKPSADDIKKGIVSKSAESAEKDEREAEQSPKPVGIPLKFLEDPEKGNVFIGRKRGLFKKYGYEAALHIGRLEEPGYGQKAVYLDSLNPHVIFVCGARGSGKSYVLGVMAEEIAKSNPNVGTVVIDPVGVFWSMKHANKEEREVKLLSEWGLKPEGLQNLKVFIPEGCKDETPRSTYDATYSLPPALLTADDWALTFGIDRFSPTGLLLDISLKKVRHGYRTVSGKSLKGKPKGFSLEEVVACLQTDSELNSREKGYKQDTIRALVSRFEAARSWGVFSSNGTPLAELSAEGQLTIIDTSFLEENVTSLVVGILARRILAARKITTRKEAAKRYKSEDVQALLETDIPPTWLYIDEAHTLIPSGNVRTPASDAIVEYVKQGRRPGCSLVFATQQPSAIDTRVLSQLDILLAHKLVFDDDVKAVYKRTPTIIPSQYRKASFIKTIPIGLALTSDRSEETSRAFLMKVRPRMSQHEGREAEALGRTTKLTPADAKKLVVELLLGDLGREGKLDMATVEKAVNMLAARYKAAVKLADVLAELEKRGAVIGQDSVSIPVAETKGEQEGDSREEKGEETPEAGDGAGAAQEAEKTELLAIPVKIPEREAERIAERHARKKVLGLLGKAERIEEVRVRYLPIWKVTYDIFTSPKEFITRTCYIDSIGSEFLHFRKGGFVESCGLADINGLDSDETAVLKILTAKKELPAGAIAEATGFSDGKAKRILDKLVETGAAARGEQGSAKKGAKPQSVFWLKKKLDLPPNERHDFLGSMKDLPFERVEAVEIEKPKLDRGAVPGLLKKIWPGVVVKRVEELYRPAYRAVLSDEKQRQRTICLDGFTGKLLG